MSVYKNDDPDFLKIALESIYDQQTRKPDEVVVVFDGPLSERLYAVLDEFKKGREEVVKYYPQEVNRGLGEALRIGSELCTGDYILRMDSDDISDKERFAKQIAYVEAHPEVDGLGGDIAEFNEDPFKEETRLTGLLAKARTLQENQRYDEAEAVYVELLKRGDVNQCSFGFMIESEETEFREDGSIHWTIRKVKLFEVSVCTFPAYEATEVSARKADYEEIQKRKTEKWRAEMHAKLNKEEAE